MSDFLFQLTSATIEDRLPPAYSSEVDKKEILEDDFLELVQQEKAEKRIDGACVVFLFGRLEDGKSVCVKVEGYKPKLYFDFDVSETDLKIQLLKEVSNEMRGEARGLEVEKRRFANFNGYEPDASSPSERLVHTYYEVRYPTLRAWRRAVSLRRGDEDKIREAMKNGHEPPERTYKIAHEHSVDPLVRFVRENGLICGGWNRVVQPSSVELRFSTCDVEVEARRVEGDSSVIHMSKYVILYFDLETLGLDPSSAEIIQASLVFETSGKKEVEKHCICIGSVSPLEGSTLHCVRTEEALLKRFRRLVVEKDPDFVVAYNGVNFDNRYLAVRAQLKKGGAEETSNNPFFFLSRFALKPSRLAELRLSSSGMGDNLYSYLDMPGRANLDFYVKFKVDEPSEVSWSLSHFTRKYVPGEDKEDMDYKEIPILQAGNEEDRRRLASYCVHDSYLLSKLNSARNIVVIILQFAQVFGIPPEWVYFRGQQVRFISQLLEAVRSLEAVPLLIQTPKQGFVGAFDSEGFQGAVVNDPLSGFYKEPVATLDWKSLYPSIMMAHNLCHSTHVVDEAYRKEEGVVSHRVRSLGLRWEEETSPSESEAEGALLFQGTPLQALLKKKRREAIVSDKTSSDAVSFSLSQEEWESCNVSVSSSSLVLVAVQGEGDATREIYARPVGEHTTYFTTKKKGILPTIVENLLEERNNCKKMMKKNAKMAKELKEADPEKAAECAMLADVFDGRQLAVKVSANSIYGACGAGATGKCPNKDVSETVTFEGRHTMDILKDALAKKYEGIVVVYGDTDSVMVKFKDVSDLHQCAKLAQEAADFITDMYADLGFPSMILEFEKVFFPYLLIRKKRYIGLKFEPDGEEMICKGIDSKGVETERKDTLPFLKVIYNDVKEELMRGGGPVPALTSMENHLWKLIRNDVVFDQFIMSKGLKSSYSDPTTQVQWIVNEKKRKREAGSETAVGDRVSYVIVNGPEGAKTTDLAEDPVFALSNGLKLNRLWYFVHAIKNPMISLFSQIKEVDVSSLFRRVEAELQREKVGGTSLGEDCVSSSSLPSSSDPLLEEKKPHVPRLPPPPPRRKKK